MKILMVNYPHWALFHGGDSVALSKTAAALRTLGMVVDECCDPDPDAAGYDIAHVFNLRTYEDTSRQVASLRRAGVPIVLTPFYMTTGYADWAIRILHAILTGPHADVERPALFADYQSRQLTATVPSGQLLTADSAFRPPPATQDLARSILTQVDRLLPNSFLEMDRLRKDLSAVDTRFTIVPLGADAETFLDADPELFIRRYGLRDFVLQVSRVEPYKNQLGLVYALRSTNIPVVLIGKPIDSVYVEACRQFGPRNLTILPYLPLNELRSAYAAARVHVQANWTETCGLVSLEAALAGCNVVCSTGGHELEFFRDLAYYCDPVDLGSIRSAVEQARSNYERDAPRRQALRDLIQREYNWRRVAEQTLEVYRRVIGDRVGRG